MSRSDEMGQNIALRLGLAACMFDEKIALMPEAMANIITIISLSVTAVSSTGWSFADSKTCFTVKLFGVKINTAFIIISERISIQAYWKWTQR